MSRLEKTSAQYRDPLMAKNEFNLNDEYNVGHPDALSTGDEEGKGDVNGSVGGLTDIKTREKLVAKNKYGKNKEYNSGVA